MKHSDISDSKTGSPPKQKAPSLLLTEQSPAPQRLCQCVDGQECGLAACTSCRSLGDRRLLEGIETNLKGREGAWFIRLDTYPKEVEENERLDKWAFREPRRAFYHLMGCVGLDHLEWYGRLHLKVGISLLNGAPSYKIIIGAFTVSPQIDIRDQLLTALVYGGLGLELREAARLSKATPVSGRARSVSGSGVTAVGCPPASTRRGRWLRTTRMRCELLGVSISYPIVNCCCETQRAIATSPFAPDSRWKVFRVGRT